MNRDVLILADALAHEKNVDRTVVFEALEMALSSATKKLFANEGKDCCLQCCADNNQDTDNCTDKTGAFGFAVP